MERPGSTVTLGIHRLQEGRFVSREDVLATEEPLEIRLVAGAEAPSQSISITMRTPGNDFELAAGFLCTEGILRAPDAIESIPYCVDGKEEQGYNVVSVALRPWVSFDASRLMRNFYTTSSCGVCGKASLDALRVHVPRQPGGEGLKVAESVLASLPERLRHSQVLFERTGGLHAAWLCRFDGTLLSAREDVGRHNAVDKLVGEQFLARRLPLSDTMLILSGRASFEMVQKAAVAGIPAVITIGAPSSLAVDMARAFDMTLVGFIKHDSFNVYSGMERVHS